MEPQNPGSQIKIDIELNTAFIQLIGILSEDTSYDEIWAALPSAPSVKRIVFDLSGVTRINSCGVRSWLLLLEALQAKWALSFELVNEVFLEQAVVVPDVLGKPKAPVDAFRLPYFCTQCSAGKHMLVQTSSINAEQADPLASVAPNCARCSIPMKLDAIEEEYREFLKNHSKQHKEP